MNKTRVRVCWKNHRDRKEDRGSGEWTGTVTDQERGSNYSESGTQVQRFQRAVRAENSQKTYRYHHSEPEDS